MPSPDRFPLAGKAFPADADDRSRQARGTLRRQQIIDAAANMLATKGYAGLDLNELATSLGMTRPGVLYYFGNRDRLLAEVVEERHRIGFIPDDYRVTLKDLRDRGRLQADHPVLTRMFAVLRAESINPGSPLHDYFLARDREARRYLTEALKASVEDRQIRPGVSLDDLAHEINATYIGFEIQWAADPQNFDLDARLAAFIDRLIESLAPQSSQ